MDHNGERISILKKINLPDVGLCPKMPFKKAGSLIEPAMSEPIPITEAPAPSNAPSNENLFKYFFFLFKTYYFKQELYTHYIHFIYPIS